MTLGISDEEFESAIDEAARSKRIDLAHAGDFVIGPVAIVPSLRTIKGPDGEAVIEPKVMQVLIALGEEEGAILSRDDLIERCWEGRVVGESSINRVISLLRSALKSVCRDCVTIENVPKVGYRLLLDPKWAPEPEADAQGAAQATGETSAQPAAAPTTATPAHQRRWGSIVLAAGVAALLAIVAGAYAWWPSAAPPPVERITVAMLPLKAGEGVDPLYARGLEAELRTQLARVGRLEVTSSESARQLFDKGLSADEICRKLGADYAWVGSLDVGEERVTLSANLIEAETKQSAFRETLSSAPGSAQSLPLRTARAITSALGRPVSDRLPQLNVSAGDYRLYLTALGLIKGRGVEQRVAALEIMQQVTDRNPDFADGWAGLAKAYFLNPEEEKADMIANRQTAGEIADKALDLDPDSVDALKVKGMLESTPPNERLALLKRATELDPGDSEAWFWRGITQNQFVLDAGSPIEGAIRMVEIDPLWPASWRTSELVAKFGDMQAAYAIEDAIASAAITPSQRYFSEARRAMLQGDLSLFIQKVRQAEPTATPAERRYGSAIQLKMINFLLRLPAVETPDMPPDMYDPLVAAVSNGELPSRAQLAAGEASGAQFWDKSKLVDLALPLFLRDGREAELAEYYDAAFATHADFLTVAQGGDQVHTAIPSVSPYMALVFRNLGRDEDAAWHTARTREQVARWEEADTGAVSAALYALALAALEGDNARAITLVQSLDQYGWPYTMAHIQPTHLALLSDDPLYEAIRELPEVRAVLDPIRANLAKEREEVLALGV